MNTDILRFCENYKKSIGLTGGTDERISFYIGVSNSYFCYSSNSVLFNLDEDDLKYLFNKYSKKLTDELNKNIAEVHEKYSRAI